MPYRVWSVAILVWRWNELVELAEIFGCETADLLHEGSTRVRDQVRELEDLLQELAEEERIELLSLVRQMIEWKKR